MKSNNTYNYWLVEDLRSNLNSHRGELRESWMRSNGDDAEEQYLAVIVSLRSFV